MTSINVPAPVARTLERAFGTNLEHAAIHALAIEGYRTAKLTAGEVARIVGLETSIEGQQWLARQGVPVNYDLEDFESDLASLADQFPELAR